MKKVLLFACGFCLMASMVSIVASAQSSAEYMPSQSLTGAALPTAVWMNDINPGAMIPKDAVNDKVQHVFNRYFANAKNDQWFWGDKSRKILSVCFEDNDSISHAVFTKGGSLLYSVAQASEKQLPKEDRKAIKSNFVDYDITNVAEVYAAGETVWIVNLENAENVVILRVANGTYDVLHKYINGKKK
ncbi:MAG: hypothetical protein ICV84_07300 [Flavisolibacter sp.]|nr:hypothetical protein [Flavisolibacter sp.]